VKPGKPVTAVSNPGHRGVGHQWSYLPDVARAMIELLARRNSLEPFATFHMAGHWDADGSHMAETIQRVVARRTGRSVGGRRLSMVAAYTGFAVRGYVSRDARDALPVARTRTNGQYPADSRSWARAPYPIG
jgi:hypothetical protein